MEQEKSKSKTTYGAIVPESALHDVSNINNSNCTVAPVEAACTVIGLPDHDDVSSGDFCL